VAHGIIAVFKLTQRANMNKNKIGLAVAQMGPVHLTDSRAAVVRRLLEMMREAKARQTMHGFMALKVPTL
jgi:hypothetical protein